MNHFCNHLHFTFHRRSFDGWWWRKEWIPGFGRWTSGDEVVGYTIDWMYMSIGYYRAPIKDRQVDTLLK